MGLKGVGVLFPGRGPRGGGTRGPGPAKIPPCIGGLIGNGLRAGPDTGRGKDGFIGFKPDGLMGPTGFLKSPSTVPLAPMGVHLPFAASSLLFAMISAIASLTL